MPSEKTSPPIIFAFHKVRRGRGWDHTNIHPDRLCRILMAVVSEGYSISTLACAISSADDKTIALTFDDGYAHLANELSAVCDQFGFRPTLLIPAGQIGKGNRWDYSSVIASETHLTADQIRELSNDGFDIGSHGWSHRPLTSLSIDESRAELANSKKLLEDITGRRVESISYPFGRVNSLITEIASEVGYRYGLTTQWPSENQSSMGLGRIMVYGFDTPFAVLQKLRGRLQWLERAKQSVTTSLAAGTGLYQRFLGRG